MNQNLKIAVLGGGHAGFAHAADLSIKGHEVRLCEVPQMEGNITAIKKRGGIEFAPVPSTALQGGFASIHLITTDARKALDGADVIFVVVPAYAMLAFARIVAPYVTKEQIVVLSPGSFGGALLFAEELRAHQCSDLPILCEAESLIYACRKSGPDAIDVFGFKEGLRVAIFPAKLTRAVLPSLQRIFPKITAAPSVLWTWLSNPNPISHVPISILNAGWIEFTQGDFLFYVEGMTPAVMRVIAALDAERLALGAAIGVDLTPNNQLALRWYGHQGHKGSTYPDSERNPVYATIRSEKELASRFLTEDVPFGLVPLEDLGALVGVDMPVCTSLINIGNVLLDCDFRANGQTLSSMGFGDVSIPELKSLLEEGFS